MAEVTAVTSLDSFFYCAKSFINDGFLGKTCLPSNYTTYILHINMHHHMWFVTAFYTTTYIATTYYFCHHWLCISICRLGLEQTSI